MDRDLSAEAFDEAAGFDPHAAEMAETCMPAIDVDQAQQFLELLDPDAERFTFQCFDDSTLKRGNLARVYHGSLEEQRRLLTAMQASGAGVFITVNETDLCGRSGENITRVRANFADLDGAPLGPVLACDLEPHMVVESSPGKYHAYWIVEDLPLDQFTPVQKSIAARFSGDPVVHDLPRVMRLPGFVHQKGEPFLTKITHLSDRMPYTAAQIMAEFPPVKADAKAGNGHDGQAEAMAELVRQLHNAETFHAALRSLAWRYLGAGMAPGQAVETLRGLMQTIPPWERDDRWQARYDEIPRTVSTGEAKILAQGGAIGVETDPGDEPDLTPGDELYDLSHDGLALDMGRRWERVSRHVALWGRWLFWTGSHWQPDEKLLHLTRTRNYLRARGDNLVRAVKEGKIELVEGDPKKSLEKAEAIAKSLRMAQMVTNVASMARCNSELVADAKQWDRYTMKLGTTIGTADLTTGFLSPANPTDYITKLTSCGVALKGAPAPLWTSFLDRVTGGDQELVAYLQRAAGYALTGSVREHVLFFLYGTGANGKSVFVNTLITLLSDYACTIGTDMLMVSKSDRHPTEIARLRGVRLAVGSEVEVGRTWAESKIKELTGGDRLHGRFMHQDFFEFDPQFKMMIVGNNKPSLRGVDEAIRRRLHLIPFTVTIPPAERDHDLPDKLKAEGPAILRWALDGCMLWQQEGLSPPARVIAATEDYLAGEDVFERWRDECTTEDRNAWESSADLWASWSTWAVRAGEFVGKQKSFSTLLEERGFVPSRQGAAGTRGFNGWIINRPNYTHDPRTGG